MSKLPWVKPEIRRIPKSRSPKLFNAILAALCPELTLSAMRAVMWELQE